MPKTHGWPAVDVCSTKRSFNLHVEIFKANIKDIKVPIEVISDVEERLKSIRFKAAHECCPMGLYVDKMFDVCLPDIDLGSVPGHCEMARYGSVNSACLGYNHTTKTYDKERVIFFKEIVKQKMSLLCHNPVGDPLRVFVKKEPHKMGKIKEGRYRLISAVSLVDAMIDRILFKRFKTIISEKYVETGIMIGWTPLQGGYRHIGSLFHGEKVKLMADRSSWDWTFPEWLAKACLDVLLSLCVESPLWWRTVVVNRFQSLFYEAKFKFDDGEVIEQQVPGIMKSGCYLTIVLNSLSQMIIHRMAKGRDAFDRPFICLGDDTLQADEDDDYIQRIRDLGFVLKVERNAEIEFAGFRISLDSFVPAYQDKHIFKLLHLPMDDDLTFKMTMENYQVLYYFKESFLGLLRKIVLKSGCYEALISSQRLKELSEGYR